MHMECSLTKINDDQLFDMDCKFKYDILVEKIGHLWMLTLMKEADYKLFDNELLKITIDSKEAMKAMK